MASLFALLKSQIFRSVLSIKSESPKKSFSRYPYYYCSLYKNNTLSNTAYFSKSFHQSLHSFKGPGKRSRYSDWLRAGRSGDRIPMGARFSAPIQTGPGAHPASCTMGTGSFPGGKGGRDVTTLLVPRL